MSDHDKMTLSVSHFFRFFFVALIIGTLYLIVTTAIDLLAKIVYLAVIVLSAITLIKLSLVIREIKALRDDEYAEFEYDDKFWN